MNTTNWICELANANGDTIFIGKAENTGFKTLNNYLMKTYIRFNLLNIAALLLITVTLNAQHVIIEELHLNFNSAEVHLSEEAETYIQSVVDIMKKDAIHRKKLNFDQIHQAIRYYADGAESGDDTHEAIKKVMPLLQDHHSYFMSAAYVSKTLGLSSEDVEVIKMGKAPHIDRYKIDSLKNSLDYATGKIIDNNVGYFYIPSFDNLYDEAMTLFADSLQKMIQEFDQQNLKGWIIDIRHNTGGADMPMIAGLGPLLDSNNVYYSVDEEGKVKARSFYQDGGYYNIETGESTKDPLVQTTVNYQLTNKHLPIALLTSFKTASSAEAVAAIFAGQDNVKIIGSKTNGLTTVNSFNFLEDNSVLNLTIGYYANRHHQLYRQGIQPDILVKSEKDEAEDIVLQKAIQWMME